MKRPKTIAKDFLNRVLFGHEPCQRISIHMGSSKSEPLFSRAVTPNEYKGADLDAFIDEILEIIDEDSEEECEPYCLKAEWDEDERFVVSRPITPKHARDNQAQFVNQAWRHIEALTRAVTGMVESGAKNNIHAAQMQYNMMQDFADTRTKALIAEQDALDRSHERQLAAKKDERFAAFSQTAMSSVLACLPMLAGKLTGIMPQGADAVRSSPHYQVLKSIFEETPEENWPMIHEWLAKAPLPIGQQAAFAQIIESIVNDMAKAEEEANAKATNVVTLKR